MVCRSNFVMAPSMHERARAGSLARSGSIVSPLETERKVRESATGAARPTVRTPVFKTWSKRPLECLHTSARDWFPAMDSALGAWGG